MYLSGFQNAAGKREKEKGRERKGEERRTPRTSTESWHCYSVTILSIWRVLTMRLGPYEPLHQLCLRSESLSLSFLFSKLGCAPSLLIGSYYTFNMICMETSFPSYSS